MHMHTLRARMWDAEYEEWTKTPEYEEEDRRLKALIQEVEEELVNGD